MSGDFVRVGLEGLERGDERRVALADGSVEAIVGRRLLGDLPHALDAVQLRRVGRKPEQFDTMAVLSEPPYAVVFEVVIVSEVVKAKTEIAPLGERSGEFDSDAEG